MLMGVISGEGNLKWKEGRMPRAIDFLDLGGSLNEEERNGIGAKMDRLPLERSKGSFIYSNAWQNMQMSVHQHV